MAEPDDTAPDWSTTLPEAENAADAAPSWASALPDPTEGTTGASKSHKTGRPHSGHGSPTGPPSVSPVTVTATRFHQAAQAAPTDPELSLGDALKGAAHNFVPSALETGKAAVGSILHPIRTVESIGQLGSGLVSQAAGAVGFKQDPAQKAKTEAVARALERHYGQTYGSWKGFKKALSTDPTGILMDASTVLGGAGAVGKLAGVEKAAALAKAASAIDPVTNAVRAAKVVTAPVTAMVRGASSAATGVPAQLMKVAEAAGRTTDPALKSAFTRFATGQGDSAEYLQAAQKALVKVRQASSDAYLAKKGTLANVQPSFQPVDDAIAAARAETRHGGISVGQFKAANDAIDETEAMVNGWKTALDPHYQSLLGFDNLKQAIWDLRDGTGNASAKKHLGAIYNGAKQAINDVDPEYANLMEQYQTAKGNLTDLQKTLIGAGNSPSASTAMAKSLRVLKTPTGKNLFAQLSEAEPTLPYMLAGHALSPWAAGGKAGVFEGLTTVPGAIATGLVTHGAFPEQPVLGPLAAGAHLAGQTIGQSPKIAGAANYAAGAAGRLVNDIGVPAARVGYYGERAGEEGRATPGSASAAPQFTYTPDDVDSATRMVLSEAGGEPDEGKTAALYTAINRAKRSGKHVSDEIAVPNAYEAMTNGRGGNVDPDSDEYKRVRDQLVVPALQGKVKDPTGGAERFLNRDLQTQLGREIPDWAQGDGLKIGAHTFYPGPPPPQPPPAPPADGDRVERASGGRVDAGRIETLLQSLLKRVESAKREQKNSTKPLLKLPDEAVAKALEVANRAI